MVNELGSFTKFDPPVWRFLGGSQLDFGSYQKKIVPILFFSFARFSDLVPVEISKKVFSNHPTGQDLFTCRTPPVGRMLPMPVLEACFLSVYVLDVFVSFM